MNGLSLFSGIGGLDLGLERAGIATIGQVEIDPWCRRVLAKHWPDVPRHDDVRTAADWWLSEERPHVDIVFGGFPCQPISAAGRRRGLGDDRWLWPAFADVVRRLGPQYVLLENVPRILVPWRDDDGGWNPAPVESVLGDLATLRYDVEWDCVPAATVGAPHLRDRWFAIAFVGRGSTSVATDDGIHGSLADASGLRRWEGPGKFGGLGAARRGPAVAHADSDGREFGTGPGRVFDRRPESADSGWWSSEPDVGRVAHGVPGRVDRLRGLGNAVVPQVAEHVGRLIVAADREWGVA